VTFFYFDWFYILRLGCRKNRKITPKTAASVAAAAHSKNTIYGGGGGTTKNH